MNSELIIFLLEGGQLAEKHKLNVKGKLSILHLERVENPVDTKEATVAQKENLHHLTLNWRKYGESESQEHAEQALESLEPHPNPKQLKIEGYKNLPPPGMLHALRNLTFSRINKVEYVEKEYHCGGALRRFPSLQTLKIEHLPRLERFSEDNERELLPNLTKLTVSDCYKLSSLPLSLVSLRKLDTKHCNEDLLDSVSYLSTLTSLVLGYLDEVTSFPHRMLQNLAAHQKSQILYLSSLQRLMISQFLELAALPDTVEHLISLKDLCLDGLDKLRILPMSAWFASVHCSI
ncbi:PREDICTED: putative disease resistance protein RGA3 [Populus euphratica]|uniref:Disease resistance protein RGA3 n=1 Tax=Populus euphratica TaxID=75702 RepID=A0AAJ6UFH3_POPEU|nr:PREDICTED: putative disease resistance protein RGA3 [Populus euphratica]